jgi:hypothetical protein
MSRITDTVRIPRWVLILGLNLVLACILGYWYYRIDPTETKLMGLVGGLLTGVLVYLATFLTVLESLRELDRYRRMGVRTLLENRHQKDYYRDIVASSTLRVDVMGASCTRFVNDFLDNDSDDKVLIDALERNGRLRIRLLIPSKRKMARAAQNRTDPMLEQVAVLSERFGGRVELRRFHEPARHSFVATDDDLIAGPVFEEDKSRHAPAVHVSIETAFGRKYVEYFEHEWAKATDASS